MTQFSFSISELDRNFIAGVLEGEACFTITEQNGGQSLSCGVAVRLRDDDQDLLEWLVAMTGLGRLHRVPARGTSRPQILWRVDSQQECVDLAGLIGASGFHGRRAAELETWREAVAIWTQARGDQRRDRLRDLKDRLHRLRRFGATMPVARPFQSRPAFVGYITGLVCAEGSFGIYDGRPRFSVHLRADDKPLLEMLAATSSLGTVHDDRPAAPLNPSSTWVISASLQLGQLVDLLLEGGLYGRKRMELDAWALAVDERCSPERRGRAIDKRVVQVAARRLADVRRYRPPVHRELLRLPGRDLRAESLAALSAWSEEHDGPLSSVAYERWRSANQPTRNTIAAQFGSWHRALAAAGLDGRSAVPPHIVADRTRGGVRRRRERRESQRARVVTAVRSFERKHGRLPRAVEFFRWRLVEAPDTPTQGTIYNVFPKGWSEVLEACRAGA